MRDRRGLDRRAFLELAAASSAVVATGALAAGCGDSSAPGPARIVAQEPAAAPPPSAEELATAGPVRLAVVPDAVAPAFVFVPLRQDRR